MLDWLVSDYRSFSLKGPFVGEQENRPTFDLLHLMGRLYLREQAFGLPCKNHVIRGNSDATTRTSEAARFFQSYPGAPENALREETGLARG